MPRSGRGGGEGGGTESEKSLGIGAGISPKAATEARRDSLVASVDKTLDALELQPEDQGMAALARLTALAIDEMPPEIRGKMLGQVVPALQRVLSELGQRRPVAGPSSRESPLMRLRAQARLRPSAAAAERYDSGVPCRCRRRACSRRVLSSDGESTYPPEWAESDRRAMAAHSRVSGSERGPGCRGP